MLAFITFLAFLVIASAPFLVALSPDICTGSFRFVYRSIPVFSRPGHVFSARTENVRAGSIQTAKKDRLGEAAQVVRGPRLNGPFTFFKRPVSVENTAFFLFCRQLLASSLNGLKRFIFTVPPIPASRACFGSKAGKKVCNPLFTGKQIPSSFHTKISLIYRDFKSIPVFFRFLSQTNPHPSIFLCLFENLQRATTPYSLHPGLLCPDFVISASCLFRCLRSDFSYRGSTCGSTLKSPLEAGR